MTTVFVFRVGPIKTPDEEVFLYVPIADDAAFQAVDAHGDLTGLARVAAQCEGCELTCAPELAEAGEVLGYVGRDYDARTSEQAAAIASSVVMAEMIAGLSDRARLLPFLREAGAYRRAALDAFWPMSRPIRMALTGTRGGQAVSLVVEATFSKSTLLVFLAEGAAEIFFALMHAGRRAEADLLHRYSITFGEERTIASPHLERAFGLDVSPAMHLLKGGKRAPLSDGDFEDVTLFLHALSNVTEALEHEPASFTFRGASTELTLGVSAARPIRLPDA